MKQEDLKYFEEKLLAEKERLEINLSKIGRVNPDNPNDWEATPGDTNEPTADMNDMADQVEEYESRTSILRELEDELIEVKLSLEKIADGSYGICEISGEEIERARLEAYPAAKTCLKHKE